MENKIKYETFFSMLIFCSIIHVSEEKEFRSITTRIYARHHEKMTESQQYEQEINKNLKQFPYTEKDQQLIKKLCVDEYESKFEVEMKKLAVDASLDMSQLKYAAGKILGVKYKLEHMLLSAEPAWELSHNILTPYNNKELLLKFCCDQKKIVEEYAKLIKDQQQADKRGMVKAISLYQKRNDRRKQKKCCNSCIIL